MPANSTVEPIQKEESSNIAGPFTDPCETKATSKDESEKGSNPKEIFTAISKCSERVSTSDCINVEKIENADDAWRWIHENMGMVEDVIPDGYCGCPSFIGTCNHKRRTFEVDLPMIKASKPILFNMSNDLKQ